MPSNHTGPPPTVNPCQLPHTSFSVAFRIRAADPGIEDVIEVSQELFSISDQDLLVMKTGQHWIGDQSSYCLTVIVLKGRLETAEESECAGTIRTR